MKPRYGITVMLGVAGTLMLIIACTPPPEQIEPFAEFKAFAGDGRVSVQFWLTADALTDQGSRYGHFKLLRSEEDGDFTEIAELGPLNPLRVTWCWTDSSVTNGVSYRYLVYAIFAIFEDPDYVGYSDTLYVYPESGLDDPRPQPPDSLRNETLLADTVTLLWNEPAAHDSLYYLLYYSPKLQEFTTYDVSLDGIHEWDPTQGDLGVHPVKLDSTQYTFICARDGGIRYYKIVSFTDSIMSYPSGALEIEHEWAGAASLHGSSPDRKME